MSAWVSAAPAIGTGSLDGFAAATLMSVVCAMAVTAPRRSRRPTPARGGAHASERNGWLCEHVMAAEAARAVPVGHRRGDPIPGRAPGDRVSLGCVAEQSAFPDSMLPRIGFSDGRPWRDARSGIVFPDVELAPALIASLRRPKARRLPRHAAPSVGLGSRITAFGSRMTGLFATRALASGARG
jgi:hypothetical protein